MILAQQIEKLNKGEHVATYELAQVAPSRVPILGEIRYIVPMVQTLAQMVPLPPVQIVWTGAEWVLT